MRVKFYYIIICLNFISCISADTRNKNELEANVDTAYLHQFSWFELKNDSATEKLVGDILNKRRRINFNLSKISYYSVVGDTIKFDFYQVLPAGVKPYIESLGIVYDTLLVKFDINGEVVSRSDALYKLEIAVHAEKKINYIYINRE